MTNATTLENSNLPTTATNSLLTRLMKEEGFRAKPYWDRTQYTYGFGCKAPSKTSRITLEAAKVLLATRAEQSVKEFFMIFKGHLHKFNEVRQECFIDMLFNIGMGRLLKFKDTLKVIKANNVVPWDSVARHLKASLWYKQVGKRAERICLEVQLGYYPTT